MKTFGSVALVAAMGFWGSGASAQVTLELDRWDPALDAQLKVVDEGIGETFDFVDDLGMDDEQLDRFRLTWRTGPESFVALAWEDVSFSGDAFVERTIEFAGETYRVGTRVLSTLEIESGRFQWGWQFLASRDGRIRVGPMLEVAKFSFTGSLEAPEEAPPVAESDELDATFPAFGVAFDLEPLRWLRIFGRGALLDVEDTGSYRDVEAGFVWSAGLHLRVIGAYRSLRVEVEDELDRGEIELEGPYLGLAIAF